MRPARSGVGTRPRTLLLRRPRAPSSRECTSNPSRPSSATRLMPPRSSLAEDAFQFQLLHAARLLRARSAVPERGCLPVACVVPSPYALITKSILQSSITPNPLSSIPLRAVSSATNTANHFMYSRLPYAPCPIPGVLPAVLPKPPLEHHRHNVSRTWEPSISRGISTAGLSSA